jgi:hypothetical protein
MHIIIEESVGRKARDRASVQCFADGGDKPGDKPSADIF